MRLGGFDVFRHSKTWRWSHTVHDFYPLDPTPRWGHGKPPHPQLNDLFNQQRAQFEDMLDQLSKNKDAVDRVPPTYWKNPFFSWLDAASLVTMLRTMAPERYMEIGSGNSTKFARHAINDAGLPTKILSLDPEPRTEIDALCDTVIRARLENCELTVFDQLESGDVLFFDGSHRILTNSDATVFFLELLPRLKAGVVVHIHDIFLPWDYHPAWGRRLYSEQYILAAMLLCTKPLFKVLLPNAFICIDDQLRARAASFPIPPNWIGGSFWIQVG